MLSIYNTDSSVVITKDLLDFALKLDGKTDPFEIDDRYTEGEITQMLADFRQHDLLRDSRFLRRNCFLGITLLIPHWTKLTTILGRAYNCFLMLFSLPLFILGVSRVLGYQVRFSFTDILLGLLLGEAIGQCVHELGHGCAIHTYGGRIFEFGIFFSIISGAYTYADYSDIKNPASLVQVSAAGIEANLASAGIFLLMSVSGSGLSGMWVMAAATNIVFAMTNIPPIEVTDGMLIYSTLFDTIELSDSIFAIVHDAERRKTLKEEGILGYAKLAVGYFLMVLRIQPLLILLLCVVGILLWII